MAFPRVGALIAVWLEKSTVARRVFTCNFRPSFHALDRNPRNKSIQIYVGRGVIEENEGNPIFELSNIKTICGGELSSPLLRTSPTCGPQIRMPRI